MSATRTVVLACLLAGLTPAAAAADWLITPFIGLKFAGDTNLLIADQGAGDTKLALGGSLALLSDGLLGIEADFGYFPRFFDDDEAGLISRSSVATLMGSVIVAVPRTLTRESLRPYVIGGLGLMQANISFLSQVFEVDSNLLGLNVGGGAIGDISDRTSLRFELRYFKNITGDETGASFSATRLSFWRGTVGVSVRY